MNELVTQAATLAERRIEFINKYVPPGKRADALNEMSDIIIEESRFHRSVR